MGCLPGNGHVSGGDILFEGRSVLGNTADDWRKMCGEEMSMIFQDSGNMINPIRKIGKQFIDYIIAHRPNISKADAYKMAVAMLDDVRLPNPDNIMNSYPFELSGGMRQRVGIAIAMVFQPKILLADEPTSALDVVVQKQTLDMILDMRQKLHMTMLMVTHNMGVVAYMADKVGVMHHGHLVEWGKKTELLKNPQHPYTRELIRAIPTMNGILPQYQETPQMKGWKNKVWYSETHWALMA